ncbi:MAG: polysulfide reductase NrfD [Verrucomicrobia bacterium]|jgi:molybdopterin-containing oxidoreductase family membrane subunit|nr:polysulfide reductase NrfD [Verrucomicrobiota bacterium]OQC63569.1 MAG: putative hydrogenase 2 b cytochrome subunit [Verrucomicrobia bacterium ADurb.Bin006]MDI9381006.1 polysulfide reductase NrfD [Verrucomicrobiota bacterium]NMD19120.1 polysulfide reductase NrfD [Verrucomicrobiota bacterium]HOA60453.1 polysulfide reductase NrfD [Verrucomicrobiota bacterium]
MKRYLTFLWDCFRLSFVGDWRYHAWMTALTLVALGGVYAYCHQFVHGLAVSGMTDQVSWGMYIANFTYLVGLAAAAAMLVIPVYVYRNLHLHDVVIFGELLAVSVIVMCLLFVMVDLGRPDRFHHLLLRFNFPISMLTWDVIALNGYLLLNLHICGYLIYCAYCGREPSKKFYIPFVFIAIAWAISIHTVTAFLYVGLGGRPFWNSAIIAPRFLASAFAAGPAFIILTLQIVRHFTSHKVSNDALFTLRRIVQVALIINLFLLLCELFTEFYADTHHIASAQYLFLGLHGYNALVPWIWTAIAMNVAATTLFMLPLSRALKTLNIACVLAIVGIWIEKGMGLIVPAFIPSPLGEIVEYSPTLHETMICLGIWAFGLLVYTILVRVSVPVLAGQVTYAHHWSRPRQEPAAPVAAPVPENT